MGEGGGKKQRGTRDNGRRVKERDKEGQERMEEDEEKRQRGTREKGRR